MSVYLDANVLVALFFPDDPFGARAYALVRTNLPAVMVSDFAAAEFASVINREVRMRSISIGVARGHSAILMLGSEQRSARR